jgi:hypothetical protein
MYLDAFAVNIWLAYLLTEVTDAAGHGSEQLQDFHQMPDWLRRMMR